MVKVVYYYDESCDMHKVTIDGVCVEEGNYHDFHPEDYVQGMKALAKAAGLDVEFSNKNYTYK